MHILLTLPVSLQEPAHDHRGGRGVRKGRANVRLPVLAQQARRRGVRIRAGEVQAEALPDRRQADADGVLLEWETQAVLDRRRSRGTGPKGRQSLRGATPS